MQRALVIFLMILVFVGVNSVEARPREAEYSNAIEYAEDLTRTLPAWFTTEQRDQVFQLVLQAWNSRAAWNRVHRYDQNGFFNGQESHRLTPILEVAFRDRFSEIQIHDDGAPTGKIVFEGPGPAGHIQVILDPLGKYLRVRRLNYFREWIYYAWERGGLRNVCRLGGGHASATHIRVKF